MKGFVVNPRKEDVNTFNFNKDDAGVEPAPAPAPTPAPAPAPAPAPGQVSPYFITNHIWSLIAAGTDPSWAKVGL